MPAPQDAFADDTRKVQTAVLGGSQGRTPVFLPYEKDPASALRDLHGKDAFYCGTLLGGCGTVLTLRASAEKKSHFAHRPPVTCRRTAQGEDSADHLYIGEALKGWLRSLGQAPHEAEYIRQQNGPWDAVQIRFGGGRRQRTIHVQLAWISYTEWKNSTDHDPAQADTLRTYGPDSAVHAYECRLSGYALRFKCQTRGDTRVVLIGTQFATETEGEPHQVEWATLQECHLTQGGILTPALRETPDGLRPKNLHPRPVLQAAAPTGKGLAPAGPKAQPTLKPKMAKAIGEAVRLRRYSFGDGWAVPYSRIRAALRTIGRRYSSAREHGRTGEAFAAARLFAEHTDASRDLPEWLLQDLVRELKGPRTTEGSAAHELRAQSRQPRSKVSEGSSDKPGTSSTVPQQTDAAVERNVPVPRVDRPPLTDPGPTFDAVELSSALESALASAGLNLSDDPVRARWIRIATLHTSYIHEQRNGVDGMLSPHMVTMLGSLGGAWLDLLIADRLNTDPSVKDHGEQSSRLAEERAAVLQGLGSWASTVSFAHLGRSEQASKTASVAETMALQLAGALILTDSYGPLRTLISDLTGNALLRSGPPVDWLTLLQEGPYGRRLEWTYISEGPDHDTTFTYTVQAEDGRKTSGAGRSKKLARQAAAHQLIRLHDPGLVSRALAAAAARSGEKATPRRYGISDAGHTRTVTDLRFLFGLPETADPWLAQALTHKSWAYEHHDVVNKARQASNAALGHVGSHAARALMAYERAREVAVRGLRPTAEDARIGSVSNEECHRLGAELYLATGMLIGRGERQNSTADHTGDAAQAVLAVAWQHLGTRLLTHRPRVLGDWLATMDHGLDPSTQLQQLCSRFAVQLDCEWLVRGPDHAEERLCELTLSYAKGVSARWAGAPTLGGKTAAKHQASREVLDLLHAHASGSPRVWTEEETELLRVILRRQIVEAPGLSAKEKLRCARGGELGLEYLAAGESAAFQTWAQRTQKLIGNLDQESVAELAQFYADCLTLMRYGPDSPLWSALQQAAAGASEAAGNAARAALRAAMAEEPSDMRRVLGGWWGKAAEAVHVRMSDDTGPGGGLRLDAAEAVAFREILDWVAAAAKTAGRLMMVECTEDDGRLYVLLTVDGVDIPDICRGLLKLLVDVVPLMRCTAVDGRLLLHWGHLGLELLRSDATPLARAGFSALSRALPAQRYLSPFVE